VPGLTGCLPPLPPGERLQIGYIHEYLGAGLGQPSYPVDVTGGIGDHDWGMLGNGPDPACTSHPDGVGDCTFAGREHYHYAKAACYGLKGLPRESPDALVAEYLKYDHGRDQGAVIARLLMHWYRAGLIAGFAPVDHTGPAAMDAAMQRFKGLYCGVQLTPNADQLFADGVPWTLAGGVQPDPELGHCILKVYSDGKGTDGWVTWAARQDSDAAWSAAAVTEAWVVILHEDELEPAELAALQADLDALDGHVGRAERRRSHLLGLIVHLARRVAAGHQPASVLTDLAARFRL
jgi:hypothetical protein